jgi:hypothetical protein
MMKNAFERAKTDIASRFMPHPLPEALSAVLALDRTAAAEASFYKQSEKAKGGGRRKPLPLNEGFRSTARAQPHATRPKEHRSPEPRGAPTLDSARRCNPKSVGAR